jgi:hypothetical protein
MRFTEVSIMIEPWIALDPRLRAPWGLPERGRRGPIGGHTGCAITNDMRQNARRARSDQKAYYA